ncbi:TetR/AcrR family transcriptional regulator [Luteimonas sp. SX5]|uniref:TetR/AcrR family transcriptional regulator n=1 Tax=Luteimonas galliterrae TaxID=2940486 RepID=A0ABT0MET4_9GAMM|nr:TetR/AcrR family transcriptional regulator [Luteimonas galliterrae]MCL1633375.1 TetR/AcrR family transcriptional regulator [Luteimonas galliterrae]
MRQAPRDRDPRWLRTRDALQSAFALLALERRYHEIRIDDILQASGVGRSTFYEHFAGKDALLAASMEGPLSLLAGLPTGTSSAQQAAVLLEHFWDNRALARILLQGAALRVIRNALVLRIESGLKRSSESRLRLPHRLAAHALADGMFSPIVAWLSGEASCSPADLAAALQASSKATLAGMR